MDSEGLPYDILILIIQHFAVSFGIYKTVRLRSVNKSFNSAVLLALCNNKVIDIYDPATPYVFECMPPSLKGKIFLVKSRSSEVVKDKVLSIIASVNQALDSLTQPTEERQTQQHQMIAEAVASNYSRYRRYTFPTDRDMEIKAQNLLSGAIILGNLPLVKSLLKDRSTLAAVNTESRYFGRPLQLAAAWGHIDIVRYLLDCGADPHVTVDYEPDRDWEPNMALVIGEPYMYRTPKGSALRAAVYAGHDDIVHLLLKSQYRLSTIKAEYFRAALSGVPGGHLHLIELLIRATDKNISDFPGLGEEILWEAAHHNHQNIIQMLLDNGVDINAAPYPDVRHGCALSIAASRGNASMVQFLLDNGADANFLHLNHHRNDPIEIAAFHGHEEVVDILLKHGADSIKALRNAADGGQPYLVKWLLERDPEVHTKEWIVGRTVGVEALWQAIVVKNPEVISLLVGIGVPLNHGYEDWEFPIVAAKKFAADWVVDFLLSLGAKDREINIEDRIDAYSEENYNVQIIRGGVRVTKRTWKWVGKY